jgi:very-short-patch-repair endonuclease
MQRIFNQSPQKVIRRKLRQQPITCERILWSKIRNRQLGGFKFRRQCSIDKYIVDFYCAEVKLVVEIDGATHGTEQEVKYDKKRQGFLEKQDLLVLRYLNVDIKDNLDLVLENILEICKQKSS